MAAGREINTTKGLKWKTGQIVGQIKKDAKKYNVSPNRISVDAIGIGKCVFDGLVEDGYMVNGVIFGSTAMDSVHFADRRSELYWELKLMMEAGTISLKDKELLNQLTDLHYSINHKGKIKLESKEEMAKRGKPSPDEADALVLSLASPIIGSFPQSLEEVKPEIIKKPIKKGQMIDRCKVRRKSDRERQKIM